MPEQTLNLLNNSVFYWKLNLIAYFSWHYSTQNMKYLLSYQFLSGWCWHPVIQKVKKIWFAWIECLNKNAILIIFCLRMINILLIAIKSLWWNTFLLYNFWLRNKFLWHIFYQWLAMYSKFQSLKNHSKSLLAMKNIER